MRWEGTRLKSHVNQTPLSAAALRRRLDFSDAQLLGECEVDLFRSSGPGGQHRNKVSSGVRLRHVSGLTVTGTGDRSQHVNKAAALRRLREAIALAARVPLPERFAWPENVHVREGRLRVSAENPSLYHVLGLVLDALAEARGEPGRAAPRLGITPSSLARFLLAHPKAWVELNRQRRELGLPALRGGA
jgi:hypothetical protein